MRRLGLREGEALSSPGFWERQQPPVWKGPQSGQMVFLRKTLSFHSGGQCGLRASWVWKGPCSLFLSQPLSPSFREQEEDTEVWRRVEGAPAPTALQPVAAQALPSQEPRHHFSPGLHLLPPECLPENGGATPPFLESPLPSFSGHLQGCVRVSLPHFSGHLQCVYVCVHAYVCPSSVRTRPEAEERGSCHCTLPPGYSPWGRSRRGRPGRPRLDGVCYSPSSKS